MPCIGYHCSHEQYAPADLLSNVKLAASSGFKAAMCSDHFHPWSDHQGQGGFAWTWLGAALEGTDASFGTVCAPGQRYHPAVIAQAAATLRQMYDDRFWLAVGSGEALNEAITGEPWPAKATRNQRLRECVDVMRALWAGETVTHSGLVTVKSARLYLQLTTPPPIFAACLTPETAKWAATWADGLLTVASEYDNLHRVVDAFQGGGGAGKPMYIQIALSYAATDEEAREAAYREWRQAALPTTLLADLETPAAFERANERISRAAVTKNIRASCSVDQHIEWIAKDIELGFDRLYLHNVGLNQADFISAFADKALPSFSNRR
jgi:probable non-F420 flavinoid oxidoreductase